MRDTEMEPPEISTGRLVLWRAVHGIDVTRPGPGGPRPPAPVNAWPLDAAIDAEDQDDEDSEVTRGGPAP